MSERGRSKALHNLRVFAVRGGIALPLISVAIGVYVALVSTKPSTPRNVRPETGRAVRVVSVRPVEVVRTWEGYGTARPLDAADIAAEVAGVVEERPPGIEPGEWVEEGDLIVRIDAREYEGLLAAAREQIAALEAELEGLDVETESLQATLALAEAGVAATVTELEALREAAELGGARPIEIERLERQLTRERREAEAVRQQLNLLPARRATLRARIEAQRATADVAQLNLERTTVRAPIAGFLQRVDAEVGERLAPGAPLARIVDPRRIEIPLEMPVSAIGEIAPGDTAILRPSAFSDAAWTGRVGRIAPEADPQTRTVDVFVVVEQQADERTPPTLLPGRFLLGAVESSVARERVVVPRAAIDADRVMVVGPEGRAQPREVRVLHFIEAPYPALHPRERQWAVIGAGVVPGDRVIVSNLDEIVPGTLINPVEATAAVAADGQTPAEEGAGG